MREFLKGLELEKEMIDKIMAEHGKHLTGLNEQINDLKKQNESSTKEIENYKSEIEKLNGTIEEKDKSLENLQSVTSENNELKTQIKMSDSGVKKEFSKFVTSEISSLVNDETDFDTALKNYKNDNPQYFGETVVKKVQSSPTLTGGNKETTTNDIMNNILRGSRD